jgi:hypothetical protein
MKYRAWHAVGGTIEKNGRYRMSGWFAHQSVLTQPVPETRIHWGKTQMAPIARLRAMMDARRLNAQRSKELRRASGEH